MLKLKRWLTRTEIKAVHPLHIEKVLRHIGLWDSLIAGNLKCAFCDATVHTSTIGCIVKQGGEFRVACSQLECYRLASGQTDD